MLATRQPDADVELEVLDERCGAGREQRRRRIGKIFCEAFERRQITKVELHANPANPAEVPRDPDPLGLAREIERLGDGPDEGRDQLAFALGVPTSDAGSSRAHRVADLLQRIGDHEPCSSSNGAAHSVVDSSGNISSR